MTTTRETADMYKNSAKTNTSAEHVKTADHAELARLAEAAAPYWHAANLACGGNPIAVDLVAPFVGAMSPAVCSALLSEIAALRGERDRWHSAYEIAHDQATANGSAARQAERQRDEAVGLLRMMLDAFPVQKPRVSDESEPHAVRMVRAFIANQGADQ